MKCAVDESGYFEVVCRFFNHLGETSGVFFIVCSNPRAFNLLRGILGERPELILSFPDRESRNEYFKERCCRACQTCELRTYFTKG